MRFDDHVRSERYFTATLLPLVLFHSDFGGLRAFVDLVERRAATERGASGVPCSKSVLEYDFTNVEVITEFHIARDLKFGGLIHADALLPAEETGVRDRRDAPDLAVVAGRELIICEAKFFVGFSPADLNKQLQSQRRQIMHLFNVRSELRAYRHVAIVPAKFDVPLDCDATITWAELADVSTGILGERHYVTIRLRNAVDRYEAAAGNTGVRNYDGQLALADMLSKCRVMGDSIAVGHMGGEDDLRSRGLAYAGAKPWKWRDPRRNEGTASPGNWIHGTRFVLVIESMDGATAVPARAAGSRTLAKNYDGVVSFDDALALARDRGNSIQIGHTGGEDDLRSRGLNYARGKRWKWRDPRTNKGIIQPSNWIAGERFARLVQR